MKKVEKKVLVLKCNLGEICRVQGLMDEICRTSG